MLPTEAVLLWVRKGVCTGPGRHQLLRIVQEFLMGHSSCWSKDCLLIWANSFKKWSVKEARLDQHTQMLSQVFPKLFAIFIFNCALESLIHPAGAQPSVAPFALRLPQNTQKHQQSPRKQLSDSMAGTETELQGQNLQGTDQWHWLQCTGL